MKIHGSWVWGLVVGAALGLGCQTAEPLLAQPEQVVEVTIKDFVFVTKQESLRLGLPTVIKIVNQDSERHDFGSTMFEGILTKVEKDGVTVYGRGVGGLFLEGKETAAIRFNMERPGRYEFRCSIHNIKGELLLLNAEAV